MATGRGDGLEHSTEPTVELNASGLWEAIALRLRETLSESTWDTWFGHAEPRSLSDGSLEVAVPNDFTRDWIESHFHGFVANAARDSVGRDIVVSFSVADHPPPERPRPATTESPTRSVPR